MYIYIYMLSIYLCVYTYICDIYMCVCYVYNMFYIRYIYIYKSDIYIYIWYMWQSVGDHNPRVETKLTHLWHQLNVAMSRHKVPHKVDLLHSLRGRLSEPHHAGVPPGNPKMPHFHSFIDHAPFKHVGVPVMCLYHFIFHVHVLIKYP